MVLPFLRSTILWVNISWTCLNQLEKLIFFACKIVMLICLGSTGINWRIWTILQSWLCFHIRLSKEYIGIVVFCIHDYISWILIHSIWINFLETSDFTDESRKDGTYVQLKMKKHYIKTWKKKTLLNMELLGS